MDMAELLVNSISGHSGNSGYYILSRAVAETRKYVPERPLVMKEIYPIVAKRCNTSVEAVSKAVARATEDCWEHGDRVQLERIAGRKLWEKPSPKDLLVLLACYLSGMEDSA